MNVLSATHTVVAPAGSAVLERSGDGAAPEALLYHPPGTVLKLGDGEALKLVNEGFAVEWSPEVHGKTAAEVAARLKRQPGPVLGRAPGVQDG